jgi:xanthine dehydrogenase accessory factor
VALIEAWVPTPRLVVVGGGDIAQAIEAQASLLGWETRATDGPRAGDALEQLLAWAGATAALIVTSHDPHIDAPALAAGLARPIPYIGAMGSRGTQSRRLERLSADGIPEERLERIHRPIGLNLGGRRAPEVALAIVAEILSVHCGRDGRPLKETTGPIHG